MFRFKPVLIAAFIGVLLAACAQAPVAEAPETALSAAATTPGSLDPDFKKSFSGFGNGGGFATQSVQLPGNKALVVFSATDANNRDFVIVRRYNEDGTHDRTFGGTGETAAVIRGGLPNLEPRGIVVTPEGRIFVAVTGFSSDLSVIRPFIFGLTSSGTRDSSFGLHSPSTTIANPSTADISAADLSYDAATQKLTLGGTVRPESGNSFLWTYTVNVNDTAFPKETVVKESGAKLSFSKFRKLSSGEMVIAAGITPSGSSELPRAYLVKQLESGLITGKAVNVVGLETFLGGLQVDGNKVFLAGSADTTGSLNFKGFVARFDLETLTKDTSLGSGIRFVSTDVRDIAFSKGSGSAKKVLVAGSDDTDYLVARMSYGGQMDTTFGNNGVALVSFSNVVAERTLTLGVDGKNRVWAAGRTESFNNSGFRAGIFRLLP